MARTCFSTRRRGPAETPEREPKAEGWPGERRWVDSSTQGKNAGATSAIGSAGAYHRAGWASRWDSAGFWPMVIGARSLSRAGCGTKPIWLRPSDGKGITGAGREAGWEG